VKAAVSDTEFAHLRIIVPLPHTQKPPALMGEPVFNLTADDPLD
jgi:hypothetical protein